MPAAGGTDGRVSARELHGGPIRAALERKRKGAKRPQSDVAIKNLDAVSRSDNHTQT